MRPGSIEPEPDGLSQVFLDSGTLYCGSKPAVVRTVLGSCVSVCMLDRYGRAAGMNHYVLPSHSRAPPSLRYGDVAILELIQRMVRLGCPLGDLRAKVFGGAAVLPVNSAEVTIGEKNVEVALSLLRAHSIPILARRTGGEDGLMIKLHTVTGSVILRKVAGAGDGRMVAYDTREGSPVLDALVFTRLASTDWSSRDVPWPYLADD